MEDEESASEEVVEARESSEDSILNTAAPLRTVLVSGRRRSSGSHSRSGRKSRRKAAAAEATVADKDKNKDKNKYLRLLIQAYAPALGGRKRDTSL